MDGNTNNHNVSLYSIALLSTVHSDRLPLSAPSIQLHSKSHLNLLQWCLSQKIPTNELDQLRSSICIPDAEAMAKLIRQSTRLPTNGDRELVARVANRVCPLEENLQIPSKRRREFAWENFDSLVFNR
ncbi:hypothetical protein M3Y98_00587000 [Aphelenchoides besseyi]|nr:hypothetical protein M3Y98_00587000 [Aphelenchoides besseyi]